MKASIEFVGYFIYKTGRNFFQAEFDECTVTVQDLLLEAEKCLAHRNFVVIQQGALREGVLLFRRRQNGGLDRIFDMATPLTNLGNHIIMTNLMGGG